MNGDGGVYIKRLINDGAFEGDFQIELLGIYPKKECLERETALAKTSLFPKGLNGNTGSYIEMTEEVRQKISKLMKGKSHSEEHKKKISESMKGKHLDKTHTDKTKRKISESMKGKTRSEETKMKMSESKKR